MLHRILQLLSKVLVLEWIEPNTELIKRLGPTRNRFHHYVEELGWRRVVYTQIEFGRVGENQMHTFMVTNIERIQAYSDQPIVGEIDSIEKSPCWEFIYMSEFSVYLVCHFFPRILTRESA